MAGQESADDEQMDHKLKQGQFSTEPFRPLPTRVVSFSAVISTIDDYDEDVETQTDAQKPKDKIKGSSSSDTGTTAVPTTPVTPATPESAQRVRKKPPRAPTPHPRDFPRLFFDGERRQPQ
ncbi:hypothetical protein BWQ96_02856 [Gracilariopsis chorda]|uniref:Uncharacterized protein n=1 Tax=Gracilariopsis chorda TaxID=448386 RepID=A0A2V3IYZ0_9FLOR|nr:hypothetical protein BWQ96_02856 [Gracilariopsis chorda]|eukprot:PXF47376.1 hypothetical protein BWQ96_02856 [Gracilariopsis chorda]